MKLKIEAARRQLGTALELFLADADPVSVHSLANGACEVLEHYAAKAGGKPFTSHMLATFPERDIGAIHRVQRQYWNAFKHALDIKGDERQDDELLASFSDRQNDDALFIGWWDYAQATNQMPIEAQAMHVWYLSKYPEKLAPNVSRDKYDAIFPNLQQKNPTEQKQDLKSAIERARRDPSMMQDDKTERRPLGLRWPPVS